MLPRFLHAALATALLGTFSLTAAAAPGDTRVLKWRDGKKAVFVMAFDDSANSQLKNVIPELEKRKMVGTFYVVPGGGPWKGNRAQWEAAAKSPAVVLANHTFTHKGVHNAAELQPELEQCNAALYALYPERKQPYLLAFGKPGGVPWEITEQEWADGLAKNHLINRPNFSGPPINYKSVEAVLAVVDRALTRGEMEHLDFHGVGGDWLVTPLEWFTALLDKLEANRELLWITDTLSWHQYRKERETAQVAVASAAAPAVRLNLTSQADPTLYNLPLSLETEVPTGWEKCEVQQGERRTPATAQAGKVRYEAIPGAGEISIRQAP